MTFAECIQRATHCVREGRDDDAAEWLARAEECRMRVAQLSPEVLP